LIGTDGQTQSRLVFGGEQKLAGMTLPRTITRFRVEDGQEHVLTLTAAEWLDPPADLFAMPDEIKRFLRTPEQLAEDTADLNKRFGHALARYQAKDTTTMIADDVIELVVRDGDLLLQPPGAAFRVRAEDEVDGVLPLAGMPFKIVLRVGEDGKQTVLEIHLPT